MILVIMLQIGGIFYNITIRFAPRVTWRTTIKQASTVSSVILEPKTVTTALKEKDVLSPIKDKNIKNKIKDNDTMNDGLILKVLESVKEKQNDLDHQVNNYLIDSAIISTNSVNELLHIQECKKVSYKEAFGIISKLANWIASNKIVLSDIQSDRRFIKLCKIIARRTQIVETLGDQPGDKELDQACIKNLILLSGLQELRNSVKEISHLSIHQMIKVMSALALKKQRSEPLLKSLATKIGNNKAILDIKQASDLLYSMAILNFPDKVLLEKTCSSLLETIPLNNSSSIIGSISTSLGVLRYKDETLLHVLSEWVAAHSDILRPQDRSSFLLTLATVGYNPENMSILFEKLIEPLNENDILNPSDWLDLVWSLVILNRVTHQQISSVLNEKFIQKLSSSQKLPISKQLKLLNINAAASLIVQDYKGELIPDDSSIFNLTLMKSKEKQYIVNSVVTTLNSLLPSSDYIKTEVDTRMGFSLDAECFMDKMCNPLPVSRNHETDESVIRIAFITCCYHDICRGKEDPLGIFTMYSKLLKAKGYKVSIIYYNVFQSKFTLVERVKYLNGIIKSMVQESST